MANYCELCGSEFGTNNPRYHIGNNVVCKTCKAKIGNKTLEEYVKSAEEEKREEKIKREQEENEKREIEKKLARMLISSGFNFDGYKIVKYSGYISGDDTIELPRSISFLGARISSSNNNLTESLTKIRRNALHELKMAAYNLGCNAVIGVDFDYMTLDPETVDITGRRIIEPYIICVTANGNAVVIEKDE